MCVCVCVCVSSGRRVTRFHPPIPTQVKKVENEYISFHLLECYVCYEQQSNISPATVGQHSPVSPAALHLELSLQEGDDDDDDDKDEDVGVDDDEDTDNDDDFDVNFEVVVGAGVLWSGSLYVGDLPPSLLSEDDDPDGPGYKFANPCSRNNARPPINITATMIGTAILMNFIRLSSGVNDRP